MTDHLRNTLKAGLKVTSLFAVSLLLTACLGSSDSGSSDANTTNDPPAGDTGENNQDTGDEDQNTDDGDQSTGDGDQNASDNDQDTSIAPELNNTAGLKATPLAKQLILEWDSVAEADSYQVYFSSSLIDEAAPLSAGSRLAPDASCQESPCTLVLEPGELTYVALETKDAEGEVINFSQIRTAAGQLNDSGALRCYAPHTGVAGGFDVADCTAATVIAGQDSLVGRDADNPTKLGSGSGGFDFTKLDSNGHPVTDGSAHSCVRDNLTGLVWEVKTTANRDTRYVWGDLSNQNVTAANVHDLVAETNSDNLCGLTNWRLPTANELFGLVDFDKPHGITTWHGADSVIDQYLSIDRDFFPHTRLLNYSTSSASRIRHAHYWTSDSYLNEYSEPNYILVDFFRGSLVNTYSARAFFRHPDVVLHDGAFARLVSKGSEGVQP
ncbi:Protein of unknown function [Marinospirillum celere]|uniref:Lcl C-terminal domain-containing protein n=1 Tax=Marinospirillum celere TaxID=1122252 RepID=A0A1I1H9U4_9GAMM|nr:DUF1566 domain-containing protein [Marinospirillum celere]SFC18243.1 Protein of unknown function [Marinospirillum celere]